MQSKRLAERAHDHLGRIYGDARAGPVAHRLMAMVDRFVKDRSAVVGQSRLFDQSDVLVIAYGDQVHEPGRAPLGTLRDFLNRHTRGVVSGLHLLPHHPATSDDGFAVADYAAVDPALGDWEDVEALGSDFRLMLDAVLNHTSASHPWFRRWLAGDPGYADFYLAVDPTADVSQVVRPRVTPLLTDFPAADGQRSVWTTFSPDQVDLNYANPEVLLAATAEILRSVGHGAGLLRLDAVAFLWKELGTSCIHQPQTHEIIRLWRTVLDAAAPGTLLVTETNVPHRENLTYFGDGSDEAHLVYQFALPPLTLSAFHSGTSTSLTAWASELRPPSPSTTFLNFLASHDGIGLRAAEGILSEQQVADLCAAVVRNGGRISRRTRPDGGQSPYELNSVLLDALAGPEPEEQARQVDRFVAAHSIMMSLPGIPLLYFHSLLGSHNWTEGADTSGQPRTINRQRFSRSALEVELTDPSSMRRQVLDGLLDRIAVRVREPAFHPDAALFVMEEDHAHFAIQRSPEEGGGTVVCVHDVSGRPGRFRARPPDRLPGGARVRDLCDGSEFVVEPDGSLDVDVPAYGVRWLRAR